MRRLIALSSAVAMLTGFMLTMHMPEAQANHCGNGKGKGNNGINGRQQNQRQRFKQGIRSGELTGRETARLDRQRAILAHREAVMRQTGGGLNPKERAKLQNGLDRLSKNIYQQKHDKQDR